MIRKKEGRKEKGRKKEGKLAIFKVRKEEVDTRVES